MSPVRHSSSHHHDTSDGRKESGARYRRSRSPRLNEPSKVSRVQRVSDRLSPLRKKAPPVNELDIVSLEKKNEEKSRTGTSSAVRTEIFRTVCSPIIIKVLF
ncbi:hypothetical protein AB6A40_007272 [Gnathostoma spinigerum]|uniref:Uncharacterized protein n=1 Tax=Gnathostoma spinigerum TaxID=75299 RepID=A0ABD6EU44_9BILA